MKEERWIFTVHYWPDAAFGQRRGTVVGPARVVTVDTALQLAGVPEDVRVEICAEEKVRAFAEGRLDVETDGFYIHPQHRDRSSPWAVCIGSVHEVIP